MNDPVYTLQRGRTPLLVSLMADTQGTGEIPLLDTVIGMRPDRIAAYSYAHLPSHFKAQNQIHAEDLPSAEDKLGLLALEAGDRDAAVRQQTALERQLSRCNANCAADRRAALQSAYDQLTQRLAAPATP